MQSNLIHGEQESVLSLSGELTLLHAVQLKDELIRALESASRLIVDTRGVSAIDLACLQLLCAAHQSALAGGKHLALAPEQSESFKQQVVQSGLIFNHHCGRKQSANCLWNGGNR